MVIFSINPRFSISDFHKVTYSDHKYFLVIINMPYTSFTVLGEGYGHWGNGEYAVSTGDILKRN